ncbi:MAG TPA: hypothetical protein PKV84_01570 [Candidatus Omnitrophota bacterium]|nr:hypothetical protein [Candidatus Omnitrophota bacterium]
MKPLSVKGLVEVLGFLCGQGTIKKEFEVWLASDEEGNSFSPLLDETKISIGVEGKKIIFYPSSTHEVTEL